MHHSTPPVAYFSMEISLEAGIPTFAGGLGVLAGDMVLTSADLGVPMVGVSLLYRQGFFEQSLDDRGRQQETPASWEPSDFLEPLDVRIELEIDGRKVSAGAWCYHVQGDGEGSLPVYLLDSNKPENDPADQALCGWLYGGDERYRLRQETLLGVGGLKLLRALGYEKVHAFHMNEGHSALLTLALLEEELAHGGDRLQAADSVRRQCVFTTHTPVAAGHDRFPMEMVRQVAGESLATLLEADSGMEGLGDSLVDMTSLALHFSRFVNAVARRHQETASKLYPGYEIHSITNGVHARSWVSEPFRRLFDREAPQWRADRHHLRQVSLIGLEEIRGAHASAKAELLSAIEHRSGVRFDPSVMTVGFARRAVAYKRPDLIFADIEALKTTVQQAGPLQLVYAGKAHPSDAVGKETIERVFAAREALAGVVPVVYLEDYDTELARLLCSGVDLWLNNPQPPQEASGTSGMKAALNGVPSLSTLDGWWVEGWIEGVTGWSIGETGEEEGGAPDAVSLLEKLASVILPLFYGAPDDYARVMRSAIAINGSFFNAQRMVQQYVSEAYRFEARE